ncbi:4'-phosphopantetheinyl transferase superfamily protein [Maridesulfovibrio sp.]|uniref:4'-phosphopantetheinyl transferase family protein n=1 Tax=Maridesulfovibrio sp. TaxID=2795000 RepID=UPI0029C9B9C3|nr:4'-phosphopantetheinyl transferase superfamily protein [Maridesulfovibrio sp.]
MNPSYQGICKKLISGSLFPDVVATAETTPHIVNMYEQEWAIVAGAIDERKAEFCGGRICAHQALKKLGVLQGQILQNKDRSPLWPENVVGSISHTKGYCAAAVACARELKGIGLDLEIDSPLDWKLSGLVCSTNELARLKAYPPNERCKLAKIIFSVKEAAFKCQFPSTKEFIDYNQAEISLDVGKGSFRVEVMGKSLSTAEICSKIRGRYELADGYIISGAVLYNNEN